MENKRKSRFNKPVKEDLEDKVVYKTRSTSPRKYEDWQIMLKAISDSMDENGHFEIDDVKNRYEKIKG